ncbi:MAG: Flp pilus assembly protein CpaB [Vulcanimicrobiaceae bacterium]
MNTRRITLIVAVLLAVGTGILTLRYLSSINQQAQTQTQAVESKPIVIANRDIPMRAKITPEMLTRVNRPVNEVEPGALADPKQAVGDIALSNIPANSTVTDTKVGHPAELGLTARLRPGMRAVTIPVDRVKAVAGLISPGDKVDVMAAVPRGAGTLPHTYTIIRDSTVLAVNEQLDQAGADGSSPAPDDSSNPTLVTLAVTAAQAALLTSADLNTTLRLALRSPNEPMRSLPEEDLQYPDIIAKNTEHPTPAPAPAVKPTPRISIIDGDKYTAGAQ